MTDAELFDALDGLFAYDTGATDSGIHDEALRLRALKELTPLRLADFLLRTYCDPRETPIIEFLEWLKNQPEAR